MATTDLDEPTLADFRVSMIEGLGFTNLQAEQLALAFYTVYPLDSKGNRRRYEVRVDHHYLRKLLDAGASHDQIILIVL